MSDWNLFLERKLSLGLGLEASRLADAIARETLGYQCRTRGVGQHRLRTWTRLHGRSFERARAELIDAGLIRLIPGKAGRGNRDEYELLVDAPADGDSPKTPAPPRVFQETPAQTPAQTPAPERVRKEEGGEGNLLLDEEQDLYNLVGEETARARAREAVPSPPPYLNMLERDLWFADRLRDQGNDPATIHPEDWRDAYHGKALPRRHQFTGIKLDSVNDSKTPGDAQGREPS